MAADEPSHRVDPATLPAIEQASWRRALARWHERYDPVEQMIRQPFSSPGYHTTLTGGDVHPTRDSLTYAVALLDARQPDLLARAEEVLTRVVALQDTDPSSHTFGIWSWFLEEPLDQMAPPDWNWADFCGVQLLQALIDHRHRLSLGIVSLLEAAVGRAAGTIRRRDVGPHYTNIALMGAYVTLLAGQVLAQPDLAAYGRQRLQRFVDYTEFHGSFTEYNSPTYTVVALKELWRLALHVADPLPQQQALRLYEQGWRHIARRYHAPSGQWSGPHSRAYSTLLERETRSFLQAATGHVLQLALEQHLELGIDWLRLPLRCPANIVPEFIAASEIREEVETFWRPESAQRHPPQVGVTHLTPQFSLGSVNRADLWNQRRPLVAYWGPAEEPSYLRLRFLHDGYDFAAAQVFVAQQAGSVLAGVVLATDGGDRHVSLDRLVDGAITASELVLRLEVGGGAAALAERWPVVWDGHPVTIDLETVRLGVVSPWANNALAPMRYGAGRSAELLWLDLVFYMGGQRRLAIDELAASAVMAIHLTGATADALLGEYPIGIASADDHLEARWPHPQGTLFLRLPARPATVQQLQEQAQALVER